MKCSTHLAKALLMLGFSLLEGSPCPAAGASIHHYVFFNRDREKIRDSAFLASPVFEGAQLKYTWRQLEPVKDEYQLSSILEDLAVLSGSGKKLFVQLQDVSFDTTLRPVPDYLMKDPEYHGGVDLQYAIFGDNESKAVPEGWVARRWDPAVRQRFKRLLEALGRVLDGKIEGLTLPETSIEFGGSGALHPAGFTFETYRDAICENLLAAKKAFPHSVVIQYANFMPGEWLPWEDHGYLKSVYACAGRAGVGTGGPDLLPYRKGQMNHSYPLIQAASRQTPTGIAVQWGNYEQVNPNTDRRVTAAELKEFAEHYLGVSYLFWCTQEPYFSGDVVPTLSGR